MEIKRLMETKTQKVINWKAFTMKRVVLWFIVSLAISFIFFQEFWASLGTMLSLDWIFSQHHAASWGILALCKIWLWLKKKDIWVKMELRPGLVFIPLGLALVAGAILMPSSQNYLVFQVLLASLGVFIILFGKAARIPSILLGIYGFAISIPVIIERFAELPYSMSAIKPVVWILTSLGYPLGNEGQMVHLTTSAGEPISVAVTAACAGPATMGVFLAIFALMMLDTTLRPRKAAWLFVFGVVGTWFQSIIRLIILMLVGHYWGEEAMWTAHFWTIYIMFPLWYLLFAYIYFRQAGSLPRIREEARAQLGQAITAWKATAVVKDKIMKKLVPIAGILIVVTVLFFGVSNVSAQPTWESYRSTTYTAPNIWGQSPNVFDSNNSTVFMFGSGFTKGGYYDIYYYDGLGDLVTAANDINIKASPATELESEYLLNTDPTAAQGIWNCGVLDNPTTPPSTWQTTGWVAYDADGFEVDISAIPEFPTIMAAIGVAGLCFGIYWWMRKRRLGYVKA